MTTISERARAKVNLTLRVTGRRSDGYHLLESLITFADVADDVTLTPSAERAVSMTGPYAAAIAGSNLVDTALDRIAAADPATTLGRVEVEKRLPIAAGIGGGSADAAAVLRAVRRANPGVRIDWSVVAASLGADVTVCFADRSSLAWGIGELPTLILAIVVAARCRARLSAQRRAVRQDEIRIRATVPAAGSRSDAARTAAQLR